MQEKGERKGKKGMRLLKEERRMEPDSPRRPESFALNEVYINWEVWYNQDKFTKTGFCRERLQKKRRLLPNEEMGK